MKIFSDARKRHSDGQFVPVVDIQAANITNIPTNLISVSMSPLLWVMFHNNTNQSIDLLNNGQIIAHISPGNPPLQINLKSNDACMIPRFSIAATSTIPTTGVFSISAIAVSD